MITPSYAVLVALSASAILQQPTNDPRPDAATQSVARWSAILRIRIDPRVMPTDPALINGLVQSPQLGISAAGNALGSARQARHAVIQFRSLRQPNAGEMDLPALLLDRAHGDVVIGELRIDLPGGSPQQARAVFDAVVKKLDATLSAATQQEQILLSKERDAAGQHLKEITSALAAAANELPSGATGVDPVSGRLPMEERDLEKELANLQMESAGRQARQTAILEQIAKTRQEIDKRMSADRAIQALHRVVDLRRQELARTTELAKAGAASDHEVRKVQTELALIEADAVRQEQQSMQQSGGDQLSRYRSMLAELAIEMPELEARIRLITERIQSTNQRNNERKRRFDGFNHSHLQKAAAHADARFWELDAAAQSLRHPEISIIAPPETPKAAENP